MRRGWKIAIFIVASVSFGLWLSLRKAPQPKQWRGYIVEVKEAKAGKPIEIPKRTRMDLAMELEFKKTRDPRLNRVPRERLWKAYQYMKELERQMANQKVKVLSLAWQERGPTNQGGRTRAIMFDPNDPTYSRVFAAGVSGGLWVCDNIFAATPTWSPVNDFFENLAITTIAYDPTNTGVMYFGTGEGWYNYDAVRGDGIFKSIDSGATWVQLASTATDPNFDYVQKIVVTDVDNGSGGTVLAATRARQLNQGGIYRSTDGGATWTRVLGGATGTARGDDLELIIDPTTGNVIGILAAIESWNPGWGGDGVYLSTDDGQTWTEIWNAPAGTGRIEIAPAPSNPNVVYIMIEDNTTAGIGDIIKLTYNGTTWNAVSIFNVGNWWDCTTLRGSDFSRGQAWYDLILAVDPVDENIVWAGGVDIFRTMDGGATWDQMTSWCGWGFPYVHADHHAMVYRPGDRNTLLLGTDGGVFLVTNASANNPTFTEINDNYRTLQLYACALHPASGSNYALGGAQDNGSHQWTNPGLSTTTEVTGGDGAFCHIDQDQPQYQWTSYVYQNIFRSSDGGATWTRVVTSNAGLFINPTDYDNQANIMYLGDAAGQYAYWIDPQTGSTLVTVNAGFNGQVSAITVDESVANRVYFGTDQGEVYKVDNANSGGPTITPITPPGMGGGNGYVSSIAIDPNNNQHLLVTYSNYGVTSVWETTDGGANWTNVEGNLPDMPIRWALFVPDPGGATATQALLATELGVWSTSQLNGATTSWGPSNIGLANVRTDMLQWRPSDNVVIAATHGRGLFETDLDQLLPVQFQAVKARYQENHVLIQWQTAAESDVQRYIVEKKTNNTFEPIAQIYAKRTPSTYTHKDFAIRSGETYIYRIKAIHDDGSVAYSRSVQVSIPVQVFQAQIVRANAQSLQARISVSTTSEVHLSIIDLQGRALIRYPVKTLTKGEHTLALDITSLAAGTYFLEVQTPHYSTRLRFVKM